MSNEMMEFQAHNSPWTEMYDMHCQREDAEQKTSSMTTDTKAEQEPTHDALADVYNRDTTDNNSKRF
ncbi:MAG: hypothetical protein ACFE0Q_09870 [Anaerolineae bacterium]